MGFTAYCMLYCRVALGECYKTPRVLEGTKRPMFGGKLFDSVIAESGPMQQGHQHRLQVHREFVVFDRTQVYPEFCVYYRLQ